MFPLLIAGFAGGVGYTVGKKVATDYLIPKVESLFEEIKLSIDEARSADCTCEKCGCMICECSTEKNTSQEDGQEDGEKENKINRNSAGIA